MELDVDAGGDVHVYVGGDGEKYVNTGVAGYEDVGNDSGGRTSCDDVFKDIDINYLVIVAGDLAIVSHF